MHDNMIPLSGMKILEFIPAELREEKNPPTFFLRTPTFAIRDKMASLLFQRGLVPATVPEGRAILIDALFSLYSEADAESHAAFLEDYWSKAAVHDELLQGWQVREAQRIFDRTYGVPAGKISAEPPPKAPFTMREQARQSRLITDALARHDGYRTFQARFMAAQEEEDEMIVRCFLAGWKNCVRADDASHIEIVAQHDEMERLTLDCIEGVRQFLAEAGAPGAWDEIKAAIRRQFGAPGKLEKNSDSPLGTNSSPTGSAISSGDLATSDGNSTTSSTSRIRSSRSRATSAASRNSRSSKNGGSKAASHKNGQMAGAS